MESLRGRKVLVTGASGFVGQHLVERLLLEKANVWTISRAKNRLPLEAVTQVVSNLNSLDKKVWISHGNPKFDVVFHLAGFVPKSKDQQNAYDRILFDNIVGTKHLLDSFAFLPQRFVFASTIDVYAPLKKGKIITEEYLIGPKSLYGSSKLFCEDLVRCWAREKNMSFAILRYGHIYGPGEGGYKKVIPETIRKVLAREVPTIYGDGKIQRDFIFIDDAIEATLRAAVIHGREIGPINVVRGASVSIDEVVTQIGKSMTYSGNIKKINSAKAGQSFKFNNKLMKTLLGEWPMVSLKNGLCQEIKSMKQEKMCKTGMQNV